ncbi:MAG: glycosyltransferase family 2 protein [Alsobacter sp.]
MRCRNRSVPSSRSIRPSISWSGCDRPSSMATARWYSTSPICSSAPCRRWAAGSWPSACFAASCSPRSSERMALFPALRLRRSVRLVSSTGLQPSGRHRWRCTAGSGRLVFRVTPPVPFILGLEWQDLEGCDPLILEVRASTGPAWSMKLGPSEGRTLLGLMLADSLGDIRLSIRTSGGAFRIARRTFSSATSFLRFAAPERRRGGARLAWDLKALGEGGPLPSRDGWFGGGALRQIPERATDLAAHVAATRPLSGDRSPLISFVVPVHESQPRHLDDLLRSFRCQRAGTAELIFSDDGSRSRFTRNWLQQVAGEPGVRIVRNDARGGIAAATNAGLSFAKGEFVGLLDHDDVLSPLATDILAAAIEDRPDTQLLYTDEVVATGGLRPRGLFLKPAFDPVLLSGVNYLNHLSVYRRSRLVALGGLKDGFEGSQDYELLLRFTRDLKRGQVTHVPHPAYVWRRHRRSFSKVETGAAISAARRALAVHLGRVEAPVQVEPASEPTLHRVRFALGALPPLVSVVVPTRNRADLLGRLAAGLIDRTSYPRIELILVDNGSTDPAVEPLYRSILAQRPGSTLLRDDGPFNFSRLVNRGVAASRGECVLLLNNDVDVLHDDWLDEMIECLAYPDVGVVGAKLIYPDGRLQHAGVIVGLGDLAGHWYVGQPGSTGGPMNRLLLRQSVSAVTGACMLITRKCLETVGSFDEERFAVAYNDVDFCLRAGAAGFRVVWTPNATLKHDESATRGSDEAPERINRFRREQQTLRTLHRTDQFDDPAFNPWYSRDRSVPTLVPVGRRPRPR